MNTLRLSALGSVLLLAACGGSSGGSDDDGGNISGQPQPDPMQRYQLTVTNLTNAQPLSPVAAFIHDGSATPWQIGMPASVGLETLAEGGDPTAFLMEADDAGAFVSGAGDGIVMPGTSQTVELTLAEQPMLYLSVATMLVNTNDAFTGTNATMLSLEVGEMAHGTLPAYDAGTEANSELAATIPGPAGGGAGFDASRDDVSDMVVRHGGIVGMYDGLMDSALGHQHRFDNPTVHWSVIRVE